MTEEKKYPSPVISAIIVNKKGEIFLARGKKWGNKYTTIRGHIELGEDMFDALRREIKEEANFDVEVKDVINVNQSINSKAYHKKEHLIFINFVCLYEGDGKELKLNDEFSDDYLWIKPEEALRLDLAFEIEPLIKKYIKYKEVKEYLNNWKRTQADLENYKKDQARRMEEFRNFTKIDFVMQILPVLDNFHASIDHVPVDQKKSPWVEGIMHIQKQLENVLKDNGIEEIEVKLGDKFDHNTMEAIASERSENPVKSDEVSSPEAKFNRVNKIVQKGYKMDEKVIRATKVIVN